MNFKKTVAALTACLLVSASLTVGASALEPHGTGLVMRKWLTNNPNYQFSEAYKTSVWYENFSYLELGSNDRNNVLRIAVSQLGYHEGDSTADYHGQNTAGTKNYMEYGRLLTPNYNHNSYDWCACFVNWCLNQAHFDKASSEISCGNWITELRAMDMWRTSAAYGGTYVPKPADFIFFDWDKDNKWSDHIGYVLYTTDTHVYTIEGNTRTDNVALRSYPLNDKQIMGYGTPPYDEGDEPTMDYSYAGGMPKGTYVVGIDTAVLTDSAGANPTDSVPLGSMVKLIEVAGDLAHVTYGETSGYLPADCLCLLNLDHTLTYDANGGSNSPAAQVFEQSKSTVIAESAPVLEGDTFLGWSLVPYNRKVDFRAGDTVELPCDTTLYAVWEKRSQELAEEAIGQGLLPEYERPGSIENSAAILPGCLEDMGIITDVGDATMGITEDEVLGKVLSFASAGENLTPHVTLPYGDLCDSLRLAPVTGEDTSYLILRVKDTSTAGLSLKLSINGQEPSEAVALEAHGEWQYVVFDLTNGGFTGEAESVRLDWQSANSATEYTLMLSDVYFAANEAVRDAVLAGKYVFPAQEPEEIETQPPETEPETETETQKPSKPAPEPETKPTTPPSSGSQSEKTTSAPSEPVTQPSDKPQGGTQNRPGSNTDNQRPGKDTETETHDGGSDIFEGCRSTSLISASVWCGAALLGALPLVWKKKKDD